MVTSLPRISGPVTGDLISAATPLLNPPTRRLPIDGTCTDPPADRGRPGLSRAGDDQPADHRATGRTLLANGGAPPEQAFGAPAASSCGRSAPYPVRIDRTNLPTRSGSDH